MKHGLREHHLFDVVSLIELSRSLSGLLAWYMGWNRKDFVHYGQMTYKNHQAAYKNAKVNKSNNVD